MSIFKKTATLMLAAAALTGASARAQYYEIANQIPQLITPALQGGFNYRGFVDASFTGGVGTNGCNFLEFSTTQGFKYSNWFFMGVGAGVNVVFSNYEDSDMPNNFNPGYRPGNGDFNTDYSLKDTGVLIPLFTDFRFNIGQENNVGAFIDLKLGAAFLVGKNYIRTPDGILNNSEGFYFKPTIGVRIPTNGKDSRQAVNLGCSYQLITNNYWNWGWNYNSATINSIGVTLGYEW